MFVADLLKEWLNKSDSVLPSQELEGLEFTPATQPFYDYIGITK